MQIDATYSPDDNKLRLYASQRLDRETYDRVKAAGFKWAPKQELFVAPMWTPERADLAEELAGSIGDEDKTLAERAAERAERFDDYSGKRATESAQASAAVKRITDGIPLGQPILVGHHSERHARKDAERIENGMRKAVKLWETSTYWTHRAQAALDHASYVETPNVRARRIARIEADRRKMQRTTDESTRNAKIWALPSLTLEQAKAFAGTEDHGYYSTAWQFKRETGEVYHTGPCSYWDALERQGVSLEDVRAKAIANAHARIARAARWLEHYDFRLAYERAMLASSGGTATQQTGPEAGGAIFGSVWGPGRGSWAYIQKVNKVTVTVWHCWNRGSGRVFRQNVALDKITQVMTRAEVEAARTAGRVRDVLEGEKRLGFYLSEVQPETPTEYPAPDFAALYAQTAGALPPVVNIAADIAAMRASLKAGVQVAVSPTLYPTPRDLAQRMADLADIQPGHKVLEPSAGTGMLIGAMGARWHHPDPLKCGHLVAVEIDAKLAERLRSEFPLTEVYCDDFMAERFDPGVTGLPLFDRIVMNPPFNGGADIKHILRARASLAPGGRLVGICAGGPRQAAALEHLCDLWEPLPAGTFEAAGTSVSSVLFVMEAP